MKKEDKKKVLILGASGFIGNAIYKELNSYFNTYGTYFSNEKAFGDNGQFHKYNIEEDDIYSLLEKTKPQIIISVLRGNFPALVLAHKHIMEYVTNKDCKLFYISSANVFDAYSKYPSYEYDKTLSLSIYGRFQIKIENMMLRLPKDKICLIRAPMVYGKGSPRTKELKVLNSLNEPLDVFPNLIINITNDDRLTQQIHYLINRDKSGIYHLGSKDLVHHEDFIMEIVDKLNIKNVVYKRVFTTNDDRYMAVLAKTNKLPQNLRFTYQEIIDHHFVG